MTSKLESQIEKTRGVSVRERRGWLNDVEREGSLEIVNVREDISEADVG